MSLVRLGDIPWNALQDTSEDRATLPPTSPSRSKGDLIYCDSGWHMTQPLLVTSLIVTRFSPGCFGLMHSGPHFWHVDIT